MKREMHVMMVSTSYPQDQNDWKSVFISQLLHALSSRENLIMNYWGPDGILPENTKYLCNESEKNWLAWLMEKGGIIHLIRQRGVLAGIAPFKLLYFLHKAYKRQNNIDLLHINWLQNVLPLNKTKLPIVISVLGSDFGQLKIPGMTKLLRRNMKGRPCVLTPNADWMKEDLEKKFGDVSKIITVPLGLNASWYGIERSYPMKLPCKWLVVSRLTASKIGPLFEWGKNIFPQKDKHELHLFGPMQEKISVPEWVHYHGATDPGTLCSKWFPQAAGLVTLSRHDEGRPQVMLEAMASGLPVIASDLPAHRDFLSHKETGWLAVSEEEFTAGIEWLADDQKNIEIAVKARQWVKKEIGTWDDCAERYSAIYNMLLNGLL
jgi:glycosyltransferase involved in cell wall biosynthesis